tara:strand:- start:39 stop:566 length:528 start_codon:yes stop_codon:yes gene_type:complete
MWLTTVDGYYSISDTSNEGADYVCVCSHDEGSLIKMRDRIVDFAKENDRSVYVKTGAEDGMMYRGRFWIGKREHYENVPDRADHYEWRMSIPRDLLTVYNNLTVVDITYANFEARCQSEWSGTCNSDIVQRRMIALEDMSHRVDLLWPKQTLAPAGVRLSLILGGGEDESDTSGA